MTQQLEGLILDFDGVFYRYSKQFDHHCAHAAATAARRLGLRDGHDVLAQRFSGFAEPGVISKQLQAEHGISPWDFHHAFHESLDAAKAIDCQQEATPAFAALARRKLPMVILTHASRHWVKRVLPHVGLPGFLPDSHIIGLEQTNGLKKNQSHEPILMAAGVLGIRPDKLGMIEDSNGNLVYAYAMGATTAFLNYGKPLAPQPAHVRLQAPSVSSLVKGLGL